MSDLVPPTRHLRPHVPLFEGADQTDNPKPHDYRKKVNETFAFCIACCLVRPASGCLDKKPCKGPVKISLR